MMLCRSFLLAVIVLSASWAAAAPPRAVNLAHLAGWEIVIDSAATEAEQYAAEEFRRHVQRASGVELPVVTTTDRADRHVLIGPGPSLAKQSRGLLGR